MTPGQLLVIVVAAIAQVALPGLALVFGLAALVDDAGKGQDDPSVERLSEVVPADWEAHTSVSGRLTFSVDPTWEEDALHSPVERLETYDSEYIGSWTNGEDIVVTLWAVHDPKTIFGVKREAEIDFRTFDESEGPLTIVGSTSLVTEQGYRAYEIQATGSGRSDGIDYSIIDVEIGSSFVDVIVRVWEPSDEYDASEVARSIAQSFAKP